MFVYLRGMANEGHFGINGRIPPTVTLRHFSALALPSECAKTQMYAPLHSNSGSLDSAWALAFLTSSLVKLGILLWELLLYGVVFFFFLVANRASHCPWAPIVITANILLSIYYVVNAVLTLCLLPGSNSVSPFSRWENWSTEMLNNLLKMAPHLRTKLPFEPRQRHMALSTASHNTCPFTKPGGIFFLRQGHRL